MQRNLDAGLASEPKPWAVRFPPGIAAIGRLRMIPDVQVCTEGDSIWLRGPDVDESLSRLLRSLPDAERFLIAAKDELTAWDETVPRARLPEGSWLPITRWLTVELPTPAFAAQVQQQVSLRLVRSNAAVEANLLRTAWPDWRDYATAAPQIRLNQWSFAVSDSGQVLMRGVPLPPLPGQRFVERAGIAIPAGWRPDPQVDPESLRQLLRLEEGDLAMFDEEGELESIPASAFVRATRSAVRLTDDELQNVH